MTNHKDSFSEQLRLNDQQSQVSTQKPNPGQPQEPYPGSHSELPPTPYQDLYSGQPQGPYPGQAQIVPAQSPKSKTVVLLLCWFFGFLGVHRFYVGKIGTAFLMLFTFGGLGIWVLIDFVIAFNGTFKDSKGRLINKPLNLGLFLFLIISITIIQIAIIVLLLFAIVIPQYPQYY